MVLARWLQHVNPSGDARGPGIVLHRGAPSIRHVRRVKPADRQNALHGWDVLQLLAFFRVGRIADVPWADERTLDTLPLPQVWPGATASLDALAHALAHAR